MKDKELEPIVNKLKAYKEETTLNKGNASKIDEAIKMLSSVEPSRISIHNVSIADSTKAQMIKFFYDCYFNTDQDTNEFAKEFYCIVGEISMGMIPIKLEFLEDYLEEFVEEFPEFKFQEIPQVIEFIKADKEKTEKLIKENKKVEPFGGK